MEFSTQTITLTWSFEKQFEDQNYRKPCLMKAQPQLIWRVLTLCPPKWHPGHACPSLGEASVSVVAKVGPQVRTVKRSRAFYTSQIILFYTVHSWQWRAIVEPLKGSFLWKHHLDSSLQIAACQAGSSPLSQMARTYKQPLRRKNFDLHFVLYSDISTILLPHYLFDPGQDL